MFKVLIITTLWISLVRSDPCQSTNQLWGVTNPNDFCYCGPTQQAETLSCEPGHGFLDSNGAVGCVPFSEWEESCVPSVDVSTLSCTGVTSPLPAGDPNYFYLCASQTATPVKIACGTGKGFYTGSKYEGCFDWEMWRTLPGCA